MSQFILGFPYMVSNFHIGIGQKKIVLPRLSIKFPKSAGKLNSNPFIIIWNQVFILSQQSGISKHEMAAMGWYKKGWIKFLNLMALLFQPSRLRSTAANPSQPTDLLPCLQHHPVWTTNYPSPTCSISCTTRTTTGLHPQ